MAAPDYHRRRLARWRRVLVAVPLVAILLGEYLYGTRTGYPDLFWGALTVVVFFGAWAGLAATYHYAILSGIDAER
ncbi:MAG: hypothetical protein ACI8XM_002956 [Haloarculaceae archaeon]|jgi:hypothetical protein